DAGRVIVPADPGSGLRVQVQARLDLLASVADTLGDAADAVERVLTLPERVGQGAHRPAQLAGQPLGDPAPLPLQLLLPADLQLGGGLLDPDCGGVVGDVHLD